MNPAQSRRERHEKYRASGEFLPVNRHGKKIGDIRFKNGRWQAFVGEGNYARALDDSPFRDPVKAEMAVVKHAKDCA